MIILKAQEFIGSLSATQDIATFVNKNGIKKEDIVAITVVAIVETPHYTIYYYGDSDHKEITRGFLGW